jgi:hypothetical protein
MNDRNQINEVLKAAGLPDWELISGSPFAFFYERRAKDRETLSCIALGFIAGLGSSEKGLFIESSIYADELGNRISPLRYSSGKWHIEVNGFGNIEGKLVVAEVNSAPPLSSIGAGFSGERLESELTRLGFPIWSQIFHSNYLFIPRQSPVVISGGISSIHYRCGNLSLEVDNLKDNLGRYIDLIRNNGRTWSMVFADGNEEQGDLLISNARVSELSKPSSSQPESNG